MPDPRFDPAVIQPIQDLIAQVICLEPHALRVQVLDGAYAHLPEEHRIALVHMMAVTLFRDESIAQIEKEAEEA